MTTNASPVQSGTTRPANQLDAANGLALVRQTIGAMFVWVFFENLGKDLYTPSGYAGLIHDYIPRQPMGFGVGNGVDMGAASSRPSLACVGRRGRGSDVGC
jgi:hypothetical protein